MAFAPFLVTLSFALSMASSLAFSSSEVKAEITPLRMEGIPVTSFSPILLVLGVKPTTLKDFLYMITEHVRCGDYYEIFSTTSSFLS